MQLLCLRQRVQTAFNARAQDTRGPLTPLLSAAVATSVDMFAREGAGLAKYLAEPLRKEQRDAPRAQSASRCAPGSVLHLYMLWWQRWIWECCTLCSMRKQLRASHAKKTPLSVRRQRMSCHSQWL